MLYTEDFTMRRYVGFSQIGSQMNTPHMDLSIQSICHEMILLTTSSAISFIIYVCRYILGGMVNDILGHLRHVAFVATCS